MWEKISIWILALPFTSRDLQQVLWALWGCFSYPNGDGDDARGCGRGEWLLLWINHRPPSFQIVNHTRLGSWWRLRHSNWLVISTAGLVNKIVSRQQPGFLNSPSPPHPSHAATQSSDLAVGTVGLQSNTQTALGCVPGCLSCSGEQEREQPVRGLACCFLCFV